MRHTMFYPQNPMFEEMVQQVFGDTFGNKANSKYPLTDVYNEDGNAYLEIAVAGFSKDEIEITVENDTLTIKGESLKSDTSNRSYIKKDIAMRNFEKSYTLTFPVDKVDAAFENGILKIELVPMDRQQDTKQIEIR